MCLTFWGFLVKVSFFEDSTASWLDILKVLIMLLRYDMTTKSIYDQLKYWSLISETRWSIVPKSPFTCSC